jgi:hypothetical protein
MKPLMMLVICAKRALNALVEECEDWQGKDVQVRLYGITQKAQDGFLLLIWKEPVPESFLSRLTHDDTVLDVLSFEALLYQPLAI